MDIKAYLEEKRGTVEAALERWMLREQGPLAEHIRAMRYSLLAGGKRVRPALCLAAAEAVSGDWQRPLPIACALECIHTYSLIHDDLPAMDNDDLRRGRPTSHKMFGEAEAILAGDGLLTFAFELMSDPAMVRDIPAANLLRIIHVIAKAAGPEGMVGGQALDIAAEGKQIDFEGLRLIHRCKTGALITASVQAGAIVAGATDEQYAALTEYGGYIGLAFQIVDDLLNVEGTAEELGKAAGSDEKLNKATYPAFFGTEGTREKALQAAESAKNAINPLGQSADALRSLADYIVTRKN